MKVFVVASIAALLALAWAGGPWSDMPAVENCFRKKDSIWCDSDGGHICGRVFSLKFSGPDLFIPGA